jgi:hypothetical protein
MSLDGVTVENSRNSWLLPPFGRPLYISADRLVCALRVENTEKHYGEASADGQNTSVCAGWRQALWTSASHPATY